MSYIVSCRDVQLLQSPKLLYYYSIPLPCLEQASSDNPLDKFLGRRRQIKQKSESNANNLADYEEHSSKIMALALRDA